MQWLSTYISCVILSVAQESGHGLGACLLRVSQAAVLSVGGVAFLLELRIVFQGHMVVGKIQPLMVQD